jgi:eukaryotic-like serine/threonine-protein kinase
MKSSLESQPTPERFVKTLTRSGLIDRDDLRRALEQIPGEMRGDARKLADQLVDMQLLTHFQATKLLQGIWQGLTLGPFQILAPLGRGGMGAVYLARNSKAKKTPGAAEMSLPSLVALKVLSPKRAREEERTLARFLREMDMCQRVSHLHLTKTFDAGKIDGIYYIAMEYIRGRSLSAVVNGEGALTVARAARLFSEIAAGLAHAHAKGLIHRDLKPSNIMVTPNGHAKILDLGLALMENEQLPEDKRVIGGQGYVVGTMDYIAPEQVDNPSQVDARADLYSLGCSLFFALTGQPPFPGGTSVQKMKRQRTEFAERIPELNPTVSSEFALIVEKLMEKNPARRYRSADEVRAALLPWAAGEAELPLDVGPMTLESEAIRALEKEQSAEPIRWWEDVPAITFEATAKHSTHIESACGVSRKPEAATKMSKANPLMVLVVIAAVIAAVTLLELVRR